MWAIFIYVLLFQFSRLMTAFAYFSILWQVIIFEKGVVIFITFSEAILSKV